jgi:hypothetical protein
VRIVTWCPSCFGPEGVQGMHVDYSQADVQVEADEQDNELTVSPPPAAG